MQVERTLHILRNGLAPKTIEEITIFQDLKIQLSHLCANLQLGGATSELAENILACLPCLSKQTLSTTTAFVSPHNNKHARNNGITSEVIDGKLVYFLDGSQIQFKVLKNKPKNGDFKIRWNRNYETLKEFKKRCGTTRVTRSTPGYRELGNWVAEQRRKLKRGKITQKQFEVLNELGFEWDRSSYFFNTYKQKKEILDSEESE